MDEAGGKMYDGVAMFFTRFVGFFCFVFVVVVFDLWEEQPCLRDPE